MEKALQTFEDLVRRAIAPSVTFFVLWAGAAEMIWWHIRGTSAFTPGATGALSGLLELLVQVPAVFAVGSVVVVVGLSYGLTTVQQILFDDQVKRNYAPLIPVSRSRRAEAKALLELRTRVVDRLNEEDDLRRLAGLEQLNDYLLYEILGGIDTTDTRPFVDSAKALGIVFTSVILLTAGYLAAFWQEIGGLAALWMLLIPVVWVAGLEATRAQYRRRAVRLYVNFLAMPTSYIRRRLLRIDDRSSGSDDDEDRT